MSTLTLAYPSLRIRRRFWPAAGHSLGLLGLILLALGCGSSSPVSERPPGPAPAPATASLILVHAVPDVAQLDLWIDGERRIAGLAQREGSPLTPVPVGNHKVELRPAGAAAADSPLWGGSVFAQDGQRLLLTALGRAADVQGAAGGTRLSVVAAKLSDAQPSGLLLRGLHASPALLGLQVANTLGREPLPVFNLSPAVLSPAVDVELPLLASMQSLRLALRQAGEAFDLGSLVLSPSLLSELVGHPQTVILLGETNPLASDASAFGALLLDETTGKLRELPFEPNGLGPKATLYVLHASPDAGAIDLFSKLGSVRLFSGLEYRQATPLLELIPMSYPLELRPASLSPVWLQAKLRLLPNMHWVLVLGGKQQGSSPTLRLSALPRSKAVPNQTLRRAVYALVDAPASSRLTLTVAGGPSFVDPVGLGGATPYRGGDFTAGLLRMNLGGDSKQTWEIDLPQLVVDGADKGVMALYITGTLGEPRLPVAGLAVIESSATASQAALAVPLMTKLLPAP